MEKTFYILFSVQIQHLHIASTRHEQEPEVRIKLFGDVSWKRSCSSLPTSQSKVSCPACQQFQIRIRCQKVKHRTFSVVDPQTFKVLKAHIYENKQSIIGQVSFPITCRCQIDGKSPVPNPSPWNQVNIFKKSKLILMPCIYRNLKDSSSFSHKSLSCMGEGAGLINHEGGTLSVSPRPPRRRFSGIKKSLSLKQKKSGTGPFYVDIDTQDNL